MSKTDVIELGKVKYNANWLRSVSEEKAVRSMPSRPNAQVRNAWKQANGKSVRNYSKEKVEDEKPKAGKKASSKKAEKK